MKRLRCSFWVLCLLALEVGNAMNSMQTEKILRFKKRIDFDNAVKTENIRQEVRAIWPNMLKAPGLAAGQWRVAADSTWRANGGIAREWVLQRDKEQIAIVIFVSSEGLEQAQNFLLVRATENMMLDAPFVKGPIELGTLAVSMPSGTPPNLIWVFRNVCFDVRGIDTQVDIISIAQWLQSFADEGVVASEAVALPSPRELYVSSYQVEVGVPIEIHMQITAPADEARYMVDLEFDRRALEVVSQERLLVQVRGRTDGYTVVDFHLIDMATLLDDHRRIKLEFFPATQ